MSEEKKGTPMSRTEGVAMVFGLVAFVCLIAYFGAEAQTHFPMAYHYIGWGAFDAFIACLVVMMCSSDFRKEVLGPEPSDPMV